MKQQLDLDSFYKQLFSKAWYVVAFIFIIGVLNLYLFSFIDQNLGLLLVILGALFKIFLIVRLSFKQLVKIIGQSHLLSHILVLFGFLIGLIIVSFALDFTALHYIDAATFRHSIAAHTNMAEVFFEYFYLSTITFSSVGYGDMVPLSMVAKLMVILEIVLRFFVLVFGVANINQIKINN